MDLNIDYVGVCDILDYNRNKSTPWDYIDVVQEPDNYGMNLIIVHMIMIIEPVII